MKTISELKSWLASEECDKLFAHLYGSDAVSEQKERYTKLIESYCVFAPDAQEAALFSAPGRSEIGGNHTDHQGGCVLGAAVDLDNIAIAAPNSIGKVIIASLDPNDHNVVEVDINDLEPRESDYSSGVGMVRGVLAEMKKRGYNIGGFTAMNDSAIPGGSGLSSSACFENLIATICNCLFGNEMSELEKAKIGQIAENVYFGKSCGLLDQASSCFGGLVSMDFSRSEDPILGKIDYDFEDEGFVLCVIKYGSHSELSGEYSNIPAVMSSIAKYFEKEKLSEVDPEEFKKALPALREQFPDPCVFRAMHYFAETERALEMAGALRGGDILGFLSLVNASGRSSELLLRNIEADPTGKKQDYSFALGLAMHLLENEGASRVHGGGFGGTIQAYVPSERYDEFKNTVNSILSPDGKNICFKLRIRNEGGIVICE